MFNGMKLAVFLATTSAAPWPAVAQEAPSPPGQNPAIQPHLVGEISRLSPAILYQGWRSRQLIGQKVLTAGDGRELGAVRDIVVDADGRISALIVEGGASGIPEAVHRIPWSQVDLTPDRDGIAVRLGSGPRPEYTLFPGPEGVPTLPREFRVSELVGDYARLQTGRGYGHVTDAVFTRDGRVMAVLIARDATAGGGTYAFPAGSFKTGWDPGWSYYGLPHVTPSQAESAGLRVEAERFARDTV